MWWIDTDDAVRIYARMLRARLGSRRGAKAALQTADHLRAKGDWPGVQAWEAVAAELAPADQGRDGHIECCSPPKIGKGSTRRVARVPRGSGAFLFNEVAPRRQRRDQGTLAAIR